MSLILRGARSRSIAALIGLVIVVAACTQPAGASSTPGGAATSSPAASSPAASASAAPVSAPTRPGY